MNEKACSHCDITKPFTAFRMRHVKQKNGNITHSLCATCRECEIKASTEWWRSPKGKATRRKRHEREYINDPVKRAEVREYQSSDRFKEIQRASEQRVYTDAERLAKLRARRSRHRVKREHAMAKGSLSGDEWIAILKAFEGHCAYCDTTTDLTIEHIIPLLSGGTHSKENIVPACKKCNFRKHTSIWNPNKPRHPEALP